MPRFLAAVAAGIAFAVSAANGTLDGELKWRPAVELILSAFQTRPLVALSEGAGHGQPVVKSPMIIRPRHRSQ